MGYDSFTITALLHLEDLGFCEKGEGGPFAEDGKLGPGGSFPMNTNGGGLSYTHPGMYGMFLLVEAVRQLRGECGQRQVADPDIAVAHGSGGRALVHVDRRARDRGDAVMTSTDSPRERQRRMEPPVSPVSAPFWEATRERRLLVQWCLDCDKSVFYPRETCPGCLGTDLEWREASGDGDALQLHRQPPLPQPDRRRGSVRGRPRRADRGAPHDDQRGRTAPSTSSRSAWRSR